ncbi:MAG: hypothetical protein Q9212_004726 [Teloschistes hypoglaucus]
MHSPFAKKLMNQSIPNEVRNRIARPRGGRRPAAPSSRPMFPDASPLSQSFPAPTWGAESSANTQQSSGGFTFGQSSNDSQMNSQSTSFPSFGGQSMNNSQQPTALSSTGFNFAAPPINNPFTSLNQASTSQPASTAFSSAIFNITPQSSALEDNPTYKSVWDLKTPSHWKKDMPDIAKDTDNPQAFFASHAPFKWGQPDTAQPDPTQQAPTESHASTAGQQPTMNTFGQSEPPKQSSGSIFQNLQQQKPSSSLFGLPPVQQSQTSNIFGHLSAPSQSQSSQTTSSPFGQSNTSQTPSSSNFFNIYAVSPSKTGDAMSITPDTSPQSIKDNHPYGPFASAKDDPKSAVANGIGQAGPGGNLFGFPPNTSSNQAGTFTSNGMTMNEQTASTTSQAPDDENTASNVSLGSPTKPQSASIKNRKIAQPSMGRPHIEEERTSPKKSFGQFNWNTSASSTAPSLSTTAQDQSVTSSETNGNNPSSASATSAALSTAAPPARQPGMPPPPPDWFTPEQKRQLITGYRLKQLDRGLQSYLEYSSWSNDEIEAISTFYELRKQAILDADGGPIKEISNNKRAAEVDESQHKKARHEAPIAGSDPTDVFAGTTSTSQHNASKRKAEEDLSKDVDETDVNGTKRSKPDNQITYPSLPDSSSSQTSKIFGNLIGKNDHDSPSSSGGSADNGLSSNGLVHNEQASSSKPDQSQSSIFFRPTASSGAFTVNPMAKDESHAALPDSSAVSSQPQNSSPFQGFTQSQSGSAIAPARTNMFAPPSAQSSNTSSLFSPLNGAATAKVNFKRKAEDAASEETEEASNAPTAEEQRSKKAKTSDSTSAPQETTKPSGFGESIFSRPNPKPTNTSNIFGHLTNPATGADDVESDEDEDEHGEDSKGTKPTAASSAGSAPSMFSTSKSNNASVFSSFASASFKSPVKPATEEKSAGSSVFNPFASASFPSVQQSAAQDKPASSSTFNPFADATVPPGLKAAGAFPSSQQSAAQDKPANSSAFNPFANATVPPGLKAAGEEKAAGRSLFDRIEKADDGQPIKESKPLNLGQSVLKTPKAGGVFGQNAQATSSVFGSFGANSTSATPSAASPFAGFGKPAGSSAAPVANMSSFAGSGSSPFADNTWKAGSTVKFSSTSISAPSFNFTSPSPTRAPLTGLFGASKSNATSEGPDSPSKPAPLTFGISAPPKASHESLVPPSETQSESTSRATSPGAPSSETGNDASDAVHEDETHPELDTSEASKAEADEDIIFEAPGRLYELAAQHARNAETGSLEMTRKWVLRGNEQFRVLKHRETNKTRVLMKLKVNGRVILNAGLSPKLRYTLTSPKQVQVPIPSKGRIDLYMIKLDKEVEDAMGEKLVEVLEENKGN